MINLWQLSRGYREVGYRVADEMIDDLALDELFEKGRPDYDRLRNNSRFAEQEAILHPDRERP